MVWCCNLVKLLNFLLRIENEFFFRVNICLYQLIRKDLTTWKNCLDFHLCLCLAFGFYFLVVSLVVQFSPIFVHPLAV